MNVIRAPVSLRWIDWADEQKHILYYIIARVNLSYNFRELIEPPQYIHTIYACISICYIFRHLTKPSFIQSFPAISMHCTCLTTAKIEEQQQQLQKKKQSCRRDELNLMLDNALEKINLWAICEYNWRDCSRGGPCHNVYSACISPSLLWGEISTVSGVHFFAYAVYFDCPRLRCRCRVPVPTYM